MKKILFPILFPLFLNAQENFNNGTWISGNAHYGFIIPHNEVLLYLTQGHIYGGEINFYKITSGKKQWQKDYKNPEIGLNAYYIYLSNPAQLGFGASINPYINFPLARTKRFALKFKTAVSFGYISKTFDKVNNFKDYAIGSHINGYVNLRLNAHYSFCKNYRAEFGIGMSHFSDGAAKIPNLGINLPELNAGITYRISENPKINYTDTSLTHKEKSKFEIVCFAGGFKAQVIPPSGKNFCAFTFSTSVDWLTSRKNRFLFGVEK